MRRLLLTLAVCFALTACTGPIYKVAPIPKSPSPDEVAVRGPAIDAGAALISEDRAVRDFDANLPLAGVVAVDLRIANRSEDGIRPSFVLKTGEANWKPVTPRKALSRVMEYYGVRLYGKESLRQTRERYDSVGFNTVDDIRPGEERRGILFFDLKESTTNLTGLLLEVKGAGQPIQLAIN